MTPQARMQAAIDCLDAIIAAARDNGPPADTILAKWFSANRFAGSKDKAAIRAIVWQVVRSFGDAPHSGRAAVLGMERPEWTALFDGSHYGPPIADADEPRAAPAPVPSWLCAEAPDWLDAAEIAALLTRAPLDVRVNSIKTGRDEVRALFPAARPIAHLPNGLRLDPVPGFERHPAVRNGLVEVQDAGSQHVARIASARPGDLVIDLCAGAGGKTLALAADMKGRGRLIACDVNRARLSKLPPRAARAGAGCVETRLLDPRREMQALADLEGRADIVLVDAPCSGSGTWRRSPDLRWRWTPTQLSRIAATQAHLLGVAQRLLRRGGRLIYAVCSIRDEEGMAQVGDLPGLRPDLDPQPVGRPRGNGLLLTPRHDGTDGFFVASLSQS